MKVVVGTNTIVKKITVGTPIRVGSAANGSLVGLDDVNGSVNLSDGTILQYDSNSGLFKHVSPSTITGSGLDVTNGGGLGSISYDSSNAILTYTGPSSDSIHSLFNATYDSNSLGTLSYTAGEVRLVGPTQAQIRALFSAGNDLTYNEATGEFSVNVPDTSAAFDSNFALKTTSDLAEGSNLYYTDSRGRAAISAVDNGGYGSLTYNNTTGQIEFTGVSASDIRSLFNASGDLGYDTATGVFSIDLGQVEVTDSAVTRALFSVVNDSGDYGSLSYNTATGTFTFNKVTDSDIRGSISVANSGGGFGFLTYDQNTGIIDHTAISAQQIRDQFSASGDLSYDNTSGQFSITTGVHYEDSDARNAIDFVHSADSIANTAEYGSVSYDKSTGLVTIFGTRDSDIRGSLTVQDSGGLGSLTYFEKQGRLVYKGADAEELFSYFSVDEDSTSLGDLYLDSATGSIRFQLDQDSIRSLISVVSDNEGGTHLSYNSADGVITYRGPADLNLRRLISVDSTANVGDGSLLYHESSGTFTYVGPVASETRKHFSGGLGIDYDSGTGTFRIDSGADVRINSLIGSVRLETPLIKNFSGNITLDPFDADAADSTGTVIVKGGMRVYDDLTVNGSLNITGDSAVFNVGALSVEDATINIGKDIDVDDVGIDGAGLIFGTDSAGGEGLTFLFDRSNNRWDLNRGLNIDGPLIATSISSPTTDGLQQQIDALPDSAQTRTLVSAGPGLDYDNITGVFRRTSLGAVGTYGNTTTVPQLVIDSNGVLTSVANVAISTVETINFDSASGILTVGTATGDLTTSITARKDFVGGAGLDYDSLTGTFRVDSAADLRVNSIQPNYIDYNTSAQPGWAEGRVFYDSDTKALSYYNDKNDVTINVGQEFVVRVYNDTASPLYDGRAVHFNGRMGDTPTVRLSQGNSKLIARVDGVLTSTIQPGGFGYVTRLGFVNGINTNGLTEGAELYLATDSLGGFTTIEPSSETDFPFHVGRVIVEDSTQGRILVDPWTEFYEHLRVTDHLHVDSEAHIPIIHNDRIAFNATRFTDINVPENLPSFKEGNLFYFQGPDALTYSNEKINIKLGQDEVVRVYNNTGLTIGKGKVVYITGATNDFPTIALAKSDNIGTVYETHGLTSNEIANGEYGYVTVRGLYGGLNTSAFAPGDIVHVSPDSAGELVNYSPQYPNYPFEVGIVLVSDSASGGNVGGCIQVGLRAEVFENIRVVGNSRFDADVTIAGNLNLLGSETQTKVANLAVSDNFVFLAAGDTVTAQALDSGLDDLTFIGTYTGDSDLAYYVKIQDADVGGDILVWSFDSNFASLEPFESAGGPTLWNLTTNGLTGDLRHGISFQFEAATGHDSAERWRGDAGPSNLDLGLVGNYNPADGPFARAGAFRDNADGRFKFFEGYTSTIGASINTSDSSYQDANIQFGTGYGDIVGNVTGNVTGQVSDISNHNTSALAEDPAATDSSGTQYFTSARSRAAIQAVDAGGDGSFVYDSATGTMTYTGPSEAEFYQHFKDNADSWGDMTFDSAYGTNGGYRLHERHILNRQEVFADSFVSSQEYFLMYSGTTGALKKVRGDTLASTLGAGGGGGGSLFGYINL